MDSISLPILSATEPLTDAVAKMRRQGARAVVVLHGQGNARIYLNSDVALAMATGARSVSELRPSAREVAELDEPLPADVEAMLDRLGMRFGLSGPSGQWVTVVTRFERLAQEIKLAPLVCMCTNPQTPHLAQPKDGTCTTCGYKVECF